MASVDLLVVFAFVIQSCTAWPIVGNCIGVSTNTGSGFPTTLPAKNNYALSLSEELPAYATDRRVFLASYRDNGAMVYFYNFNGVKRLDFTVNSDNGGHYKSVILKDPLKFVAASWNDKYVRTHNIQINNDVYSENNDIDVSLTYSSNDQDSGLIVSDEGTVYFYIQVRNYEQIIRSDSTTLSDNTYFTNAAYNARQAIYLGIATGSLYIFVGGPQYLSLYNKADFTQVKGFPYHRASSTINGFVLDNLNEMYIFSVATATGPTTSLIARHDMGPASFDPNLNYIEIISPAGGQISNNILNFGPYQYVVTIPSAQANAILTFVAKTDLNTGLTIPLPMTGVTVYKAGFPTFQGFVIVNEKFYFGFIEESNKNFQSYYLTVDRCAVRDGSNVCTDCVDGLGLYRVGTAPNNLCMTTAEFPAGYGIDTSQSELASPCDGSLGPNCATCQREDKDLCGGCDPGWFVKLSTGICHSLTLSPLIPNTFGANLVDGTVDPCDMMGCILCTADYLGCTQCDQASLWFLDPNQMPNPRCERKSGPVVPKFSSGQGPNVLTGLVVPCQTFQCSRCGDTYLTCTECNTGWYFYSNLCYHPTLSPVIPAGLGIDPLPPSVNRLLPCSLTHCTTCPADNTVCTGCDTSTQWYLRLSDSLCYSPTLAPTIPNLLGANLVNGQVEACTAANCVLCKADNSLCTGCNYGAGYYSDAVVCRHATVSPVFQAGTGPNLVTKLVVPCSDVQCTTCKADYLVCTVCNSGWYLKTSLCYHPTLAPIIPDFFGANTVTGIAVACQDIHCKLCKATYLTCTGCDTGTGWYLDGTTCKHPTLAPIIPNFYGADTVSGLVVICLDTHCKLCKPNYSVCTYCDTLSSWYLDGTTCRHATLAPVFLATTGPNTGTGLVVTCQTANCATCSATYTTCTACVAGWFFKTGTCYHPTLAPIIANNFGGNTVTGTVDPCQDNKCQLCKPDYQTCSGCIAGWYLFGVVCNHPTIAPIIPDFFGANTVTGIAVACQDIHCKLCKATYLTCTGCDTGTGWYLDGTTCKHASIAPVFPAGKGPNIGNGLVETCVDTHCNKCSVTKVNCEQCNSGRYLYLVSCNHPTLSPIIPNFFGANTITGTADSCQDIHCKLCKTNYQICTGCDTASSWYLDGTTCRHATLAPVFLAATGPNTGTGLVVTCQTANCATCSATYTTCTACVAGWFFKTGTCYHPTLAPIIANNFGGNTVTGTVDPCQDNKCQLCKPDYQTCSGCIAGWYLNGVVCNHPTIAPIIPDFLGANTVTKIAVACQDTHCKLCKATYLTCTGCDTANDWYLDGTTCKHPSLSPMIPDFKGANTVLGLVVNCQMAHCKLCKNSYAICTGCDTGSNWYLDGTTCRHATISPVFLATTGPDPGTGLVVTCQEPNCATCSATYATCTACVAGWYFSAGFCYHPTIAPIIPDFLGANTVTGIAVACQDTHCILCKATYLTCTGCDTGTDWYLDGTTCKHATLSPMIPDTKGPDHVLGTIVNCLDTNCILCKSDYLTCTGCNTGSGWYLDGTICKHATLGITFSPKTGPNVTSGLVVPCFDNYCTTCSVKYTICTACEDFDGWFLDINTCVHASLLPQIPNRKGPDLLTGLITTCSVPNCKGCKADYNTCTECISGFELGGSNDCPKMVCPKGQGRPPASTIAGELEACKTAHCAECCGDSSVCTACDVAAKYFMLAAKCVAMKDFELGFGADLYYGNVEPCTDANCQDCRDDYTACKVCMGDLALMQGKCGVPPKRTIVLAAFTTKDSTAQVRFSETIKSKSQLSEPLEITFVDTNLNKNLTCKTIKCTLLKIDNDGFTLQFDSPEAIVKGDLYINKAANWNLSFDDGIPWTHYPIKVPDVSFLGTQAAAQAVGSTLSSLNSARMPISIAVSFAAPAAASFLDILINTIFVLKLIEGPLLIYPDSILSADVEVSLIPVKIDNPLQGLIDGKPECKPSQKFSKYGISCNLIENEGMSTMQIFALLFLTIFISWLSNYLVRFIMKKLLKQGNLKLEDIEKNKNKKTLSREEIIKRSKIAKAISKVGKILGLQFFISKLEGNQVQLSILSMLALKHASRYSADIMSTVLALAYVLYYTGLAALYFKTSIWIWEQIERKKASKKGLGSMDCRLGQAINLERSPYPALNYTFEELRVPEHYWQLLMPVTAFLRSAAFSLILTGVLGKAWQQATLVLLVEVLSMGFDLVASVKSSKAERCCEVVMKTFTVLFLVFKLISTSEHLSDAKRQAALGIPMAVCLVGLMLVGLVFAVWTIGVMVYHGVKAIIAKIKALRELNKIAIQNARNINLNESTINQSQNVSPMLSGKMNVEKSMNKRSYLVKKSPPERFDDKGKTVKNQKLPHFFLEKRVIKNGGNILQKSSGIRTKNNTSQNLLDIDSSKSSMIKDGKDKIKSQGLGQKSKKPQTTTFEDKGNLNGRLKNAHIFR